MSKGLSWRQVGMLESIARRTNEDREERERMDASLVKHGHKARGWRARPVAWREIDYGPTNSEEDPDFSSSARLRWNIEQALRRALRSLDRRGLVELGRYCFQQYPEDGGMFGTRYVWRYVHPDDYVPGEMRTMTGVKLTKAGWALVAEEEAKGKAR